MQYTDFDVLLVEDNDSEAELAKRALVKSRSQIKIIHVIDGEDALDFIFGNGPYTQRNINVLPKLILLDVKMPRIDGIEVLKFLKQSELTKKIPVVMFTSSKEDSDMKNCYDFGANSYIVKPVEFDNFYKAICEITFYWLSFNQSPPQ